MKRSALVLILMVAALGLSTTRSHAEDIVRIGNACYLLPNYVPVACPATPAPTAPPMTPEKTLAVAGGLTEPQGVTDYTVSIVSRVACFSLDEPVLLYTFGNPGAAVLRPATPGSMPISNPNAFQVSVDPTGRAVLSLEVSAKNLDEAGLRLKAVWPEEGIERLIPLYAPATATATATAAPATTATPVSTAGSGTATPTGTPTAAVPSRPFFVRICVTPNPIPGGGQATAYVQSIPGAVCGVSVLFFNGATVPSLEGETQTLTNVADVAGFTFTADQGTDAGFADATCTYGDQKLTATTEFRILPPSSR